MEETVYSMQTWAWPATGRIPAGSLWWLAQLTPYGFDYSRRRWAGGPQLEGVFEKRDLAPVLLLETYSRFLCQFNCPLCDIQNFVTHKHTDKTWKDPNKVEGDVGVGELSGSSANIL